MLKVSILYNKNVGVPMYYTDISSKETLVWPAWIQGQFDAVTVNSLFPQLQPCQLVQSGVVVVKSIDDLCRPL